MAIPEWFSRTKWGKQLSEAHESERLESRRKLAEKLVAAKKHCEQQSPALAARAWASREAVEEARSALEAAQLAAGQAWAELSGLSNQTELTINQLERELRETADPAIAAFLLELNDLQDQSRRRDFAAEGDVNVRKRQAALRDLRAAAEALQLEADADVAGRLTELRAAAALAMLPAPAKPAPKVPEPLTSQNYWDQRREAAAERALRWQQLPE